MTFEQRVKIGVEFCNYIQFNRIKMPKTIKSRRMVFIKWYLNRYGHRSFNSLFVELSNEILYIKEVTLERIIFNER